MADANRKLQATDTYGGRQEALKSIADRGYSRGERAFDTALLDKYERDTGGLSKLRDQYSQVAQRSAQDVQNQAAQARQGIRTYNEGMRGQARSWLQGQGRGLQDRISAADRDATAAYQDQIRSRLRDDYAKAMQGRVDQQLAKEREAMMGQYKTVGPRDVAAYLDRSASPAEQTQAEEADKAALADYTRSTDEAMARRREELLRGNTADSRMLGAKDMIDAARAQGSLSPEMSRELSNYQALRGLAGTGQDISRQAATGFDYAGALQRMLSGINF